MVNPPPSNIDIKKNDLLMVALGYIEPKDLEIYDPDGKRIRLVEAGVRVGSVVAVGRTSLGKIFRIEMDENSSDKAFLTIFNSKREANL